MWEGTVRWGKLALWVMAAACVAAGCNAPCVWEYSYAGRAPEEGKPGDGDAALAAVPDGGVVMCGYTDRPDLDIELVVDKLSADGALVWTKTYQARPGAYTYGHAVTAAGEGTIVAVGVEAWETTYLGRWFVRKMAADGSDIWAENLRGPEATAGRPNAVSVDASGSLYVAGYMGRGAWHVAKFAPTGLPIWEVHDGSARSHCEARAVATGPYGEVVTVGWGSAETGRGTVWIVRKHDAGGTLAWSLTYGDPGKLNEARGVLMDAQGGMVVAGAAGGYPEGMIELSGTRLVIRRYDAIGSLSWEETYSSSRSDELGMVGMDRMPDGGFVLAAVEHRRGPWPCRRWLILRYDAEHHLVWRKVYSSNRGGWDVPYGICVDAAGRVVVCGLVMDAKPPGHGEMVIRAYRDSGWISNLFHASLRAVGM